MTVSFTCYIIIVFDNYNGIIMIVVCLFVCLLMCSYEDHVYDPVAIEEEDDLEDDEGNYEPMDGKIYDEPDDGYV